MCEGEDKYPHLLFVKYLQAGEIICVVLMILTVISVLVPFFVLTGESGEVFKYYTDIIDLFLFTALLLIFRHYLLNFDLHGVRKALLILAVASLAISIIDRIYIFLFLSDESYDTIIWDDYSLIGIVDLLWITAGNLIFWACFTYIGVNLYRYKDDFVGGLQPLGKVCFIIVATGVLAEMGSLIVNLYVGDNGKLTRSAYFLNDMAYIYMLYVMHFIFRSAQKYIRDSE